MIDEKIPKLSKKYRTIYIVDAASQWSLIKEECVKKNDLILTFDLGLKKELNEEYQCYYVDHLVGQTEMEANNFLIYEFFKTWHINKSGEDIFKYENADFGMSFRLDFWHDYICFFRLYFCISQLLKIQFDCVFVVSNNEILHQVLSDLNIKYQSAETLVKDDVFFYFPIERYMNDRVRPTGTRKLLYIVRSFVSNIYGSAILMLDRLFCHKSTKTIFVQEYHPTKKIISRLREEKNINVLLCNFSRNESWINNSSERLLPLWNKEKEFTRVAKKILSDFEHQKCQKMVLKNGEDITKIAYKIIIARVIQSLPKKLSILDASLKYLDKNPINLSVIIANIGECSTVFDLACKSRGIPSYLIINGILGPRFSDESKHATYINSYSESIKNNYFKDLSNIIVLGDPRMDDYANLLKKSINRVSPTVVIGASGYSPVDLNSYVAIEFDFMHDVLEALDAVKKTGIDLKVVIKVRPNGYLQQYKRFVSKYFPDLVNNVTAIRTIRQVLTKADLYISINSQTLFEASCIGIPVIYYKIDNEVMPPPFDFNQDLVTVCSVAHLIDAVHLFIADSPIYKIFLNRKIMEKYIGFIDGDNLERNINFIKKLTKHKVE